MIRAPATAPVAALCAALVGAVGCGDARTGDGWAGTVDTLAGGAVVVRSPASGSWTDTERWRLEEDLRLGSVDGEGPEQFVRPTDLMVDGADRLWILDAGANELRVFTATGEHVRTVGGPGAGPGELGSPWSVSFAPDGTVWVQDIGNRRYSVFDTAGTYIRSEPMRGLAFSGGDVWGPDGRFNQLVSLPREGSLDADRAVVPHALDGNGLTPGDTVVLPALTPEETVDVTWQSAGRVMRMRRPVPFSHPPAMALAPDAGIWVSEGGGAYRIVELGPGLDTVKIVEREYDPVAVSDSAIDAALAGLGPEGATADLDRREISRVHPPFDGFHVDPSGTLWVRRRAAPDTVAYDVFDSEGRYLGEVGSDRDLGRFDLLEITDDALYGVIPDDLDVPSVVRLRVIRPE